MATKKISELEAITQADDSDVLVIVDVSAGITYKITKANLLKDLTDVETTTNKVTSIDNTSTDTQYPSAKAVYTIVGDIESILEELDIGGGA